MLNSMTDARKRKKLTQAELGQLVGVTQRAIAAYEAGERRPSPKVLSRLIDALDMSLYEAWTLFYADDAPGGVDGDEP